MCSCSLHICYIVFIRSFVSFVHSGTTYMAACGLEASRRDSMRSNESDESFGDNVVKVMAQFAVQMMAVLDRMNARSFTASKQHK